MVAANATRETIDAKFQAGYQYPASCWLCRIRPKKDGSHKTDRCHILKNLFAPYPTIGTSCRSIALSSNTNRDNASNKRKNSKPKSRPAAKAPIIHTPEQMCYDTGTMPKSLCSDKQYFRELMVYDKPKRVALADPDITAKVLGQGILDIIVNDQHRLWLFAYLTEKSDLLMSAVDHLSYKNCEIHGKNGVIQDMFPTFSFNVKASENFECSVTPGKDSGKPVLWQPSEHGKITDITVPNRFQIKLLSPDSILPQRATVDSTGYDVAANTTVTIKPSSTVLVPLGFSMSFDPSLKCDLRPRSGLSLTKVNVAFGTIDPDYRGEVKAIVTNNSDKPFEIHHGQRLGQLVFSPVSHPTPVRVLYLDATKRGIQGFGSTGSSSLPSS